MARAHRLDDVAEERRMQVAEETHVAPVGVARHAAPAARAASRAAPACTGLPSSSTGAEVLAVEREVRARPRARARCSAACPAATRMVRAGSYVSPARATCRRRRARCPASRARARAPYSSTSTATRREALGEARRPPRAPSPPPRGSACRRGCRSGAGGRRWSTPPQELQQLDDPRGARPRARPPRARRGSPARARGTPRRSRAPRRPSSSRTRPRRCSARASRSARGTSRPARRSRRATRSRCRSR